jgi:glutathione S-transferase
MLRLYHALPRPGYPGSHSALKVAVLLAELGLDHEVVDLDPERELRPADAPYRHLNPNGLTPALDDDGYVLWESSAILQYLAETRGPTPLLPDAARSRGRVRQWLAWEGTTLTPALMALFLAHMGQGGDAQAAHARVAALLGILDTQLAPREYVADAYSLADLALGANVPALGGIGVAFAPYPAVLAWVRRLAARPAWAQQAIFRTDVERLGIGC